MSQLRVIALSGGVGGAKLALGLYRVVGAHELAVIVNTGDDFEHLGLHISPDIDTVLYTLSGRSNPKTGWGRAHESWSFMVALAELGAPTWFQLGDKDLALHVLRTHRLRQGVSLNTVTRELAAAFGVSATVWPMSNQAIRTKLLTAEGWMEFQTYFVEQRCAPPVRALEYAGAPVASATPELLSELQKDRADVICICPSNPYLSIDPILSIREIREALGRVHAPVVAVSPIVAGRSVKGPTAKIMGELGLQCTATSVARHYHNFIDGLIIDERDRAEVGAIEKMGIKCAPAKTIMRTLEDRCALAREVLRFAARLGAGKPLRARCG